MTQIDINKIKQEIEIEEPRAERLWAEHTAKEAELKPITNEWHRSYTRLQDLRKLLELCEKSVPV